MKEQGLDVKKKVWFQAWLCHVPTMDFNLPKRPCLWRRNSSLSDSWRTPWDNIETTFVNTKAPGKWETLPLLETRTSTRTSGVLKNYLLSLGFVDISKCSEKVYKSSLNCSGSDWTHQEDYFSASPFPRHCSISYWQECPTREKCTLPSFALNEVLPGVPYLCVSTQKHYVFQGQ